MASPDNHYWHSKYQNLPQRLNHLRDGDLYCDCEFIINKNVVKCHKLILAASSPVFEAMFYGSMADQQDPKVPVAITDITYDIFVQMIRWVYSNEIKLVTCDNACELYQAAKKYLLEDLLMICVSYLETNIDCNNVLQLSEFAKFHIEKKLEELCLKVIQRNISEVLKSEAIKDVPESTMLNILTLDDLKISSELDLINAVETWANAEAEKKGVDCPRSVANSLVEKLRFLTLTVDEFVSGPANSKLLTDGEKFEILLRINKPNTSPMKCSLSNLTVKRGSQSLIVDRRSFACVAYEFARTEHHKRFTKFYMAFSGSEWIILHAIKINTRSGPNPEDAYIENITAELRELSEDENLTEGRLNHSVYYNSQVPIMLNEDIVLVPEREYLIIITLLKAGKYRVGSVPSHFGGDDGVIFEVGSAENYVYNYDYNPHNNRSIFDKTLLNGITYSTSKFGAKPWTFLFPQ